MHYNFKHTVRNHGFGSKGEYRSVYVGLHSAIKKAITSKALEEHTKLPPTRVLAKDLEISRSTVIKAYDLLVLEKYIDAVPGSGYYVASKTKDAFRNNVDLSVVQQKYPLISKRGNSFKKSIQIKENRSNKGIAFRPGLPPLDIFPVRQWQNLSNEYWKRVKSSELSYSNTIGLRCLRENISNYLKIYRNIECEAYQIIITTGSLHSLSLIGDALVDKGDEVVLENPTYPHAYHLFHGLNAKICAIDIDREGIDIENAKCKKPKLVYTTPSNQYPSGIKMSINRRLELLKWASDKNTFVVEDDYDHEFSNWENPIASMYSMDHQERVIYLGTFNKILHPSIRLGYMIVPHYLLDTIKALYGQSSRFVAPSMQKTLSFFIEKDYLNKHLRNVISISMERKEVFIKYFTQKLSKAFKLETNPLGLHIIARPRHQLSDRLISTVLTEKDITVHPYSKYFIGSDFDSGMVMGYASVHERVIEKKIGTMKMQLGL